MNRWALYLPSLSDPEEYHELPIDGILDLHRFNPGEVKDLVPDYLQECRRNNILQVRIIHGKGTGKLRGLVHSILDRLDYVHSYSHPSHAGSWGATSVDLKPPGKGKN